MVQLQQLKGSAEAAVQDIPLLQESHKETARKLIRAKAELEILQLDNKQVRNTACINVMKTDKQIACKHASLTAN